MVLKRIQKDQYSTGTETEIACYVSVSALQDNPDNHCVRVLEVLHNPADGGFEVLVMPLLRPFDSPRFETVGEGIDFFQQAFKVCLRGYDQIGCSFLPFYRYRAFNFSTTIELHTGN